MLLNKESKKKKSVYVCVCVCVEAIKFSPEYAPFNHPIIFADACMYTFQNVPQRTTLGLYTCTDLAQLMPQ